MIISPVFEVRFKNSDINCKHLNPIFRSCLSILKVFDLFKSQVYKKPIRRRLQVDYWRFILPKFVLTINYLIG